MKLYNSIKDVRGYELYQDSLVINWLASKHVSIIVADNFQEPVALGIKTEGLWLYKSYLFCPGMHIVDLDRRVLIKETLTDCFFEIGYGDKAIISRYDARNDTSTLCLLNLNTWQLDDIREPIKGGIVAGKEEVIITVDGSKIYCYNRFSLVWEKDLSGVGSYTDIFGKQQEGVIYRSGIKIYEDRLIVVIGRKMMAYALSTGYLIWELEMQKAPFGLYLVIDGDTGYCTDSLGYISVDLKAGAFLSGVIVLKQIIIKDKTIIPSGRDMVVKDGLLWHSISDNGVNIIAAIEPASGDYISYQQVKARGWISAPRFHENKMYLLTSERELLIFGKE